MMTHTYSIPEEELTTCKKNNDWLGILRLYHLQLLDHPVDLERLTVDDISEVLFAASHWADNLQKQACDQTGGERALRAFLWLWNNAARAYKHHQSVKLLEL